MKKIFVLGLLLCMLFCGCDGIAVVPDPTPEESTGGGAAPSESGEDSSANQNSDTALRLAYYEQLVGELQQELLQIKTELYTSRVEYEARIAELEAQRPSDSDTDAPVPDVGADFLYTVKDGVATVTAYTGNARQVTVPAALGGYPVWAIADRAFSDHTAITSVTLPKTVSRIGWFAFSGCISLESISIPETVESIAYGAFQNCPSTLTVTCVAGSYAEQYARSYGFRTN